MDGIISCTPGQQSLPCNLLSYTEKTRAIPLCTEPCIIDWWDVHDVLYLNTFVTWRTSTTYTIPCQFSTLHQPMMGSWPILAVTVFDFVNILRKFPQPTERDHVSKRFKTTTTANSQGVFLPNSLTPETPVDTFVVMTWMTKFDDVFAFIANNIYRPGVNLDVRDM